MKIYLLMALIGILLTAIHLTSTPKRDRKRFRSKRSTSQARASPIELQGIASGNTAFPARSSATRSLGIAGASLSISAAWIWVGALPPLIALTSTRIAGAAASPWTGKILRLPKPRPSAARTSAEPVGAPDQCQARRRISEFAGSH